MSGSPLLERTAERFPDAVDDRPLVPTTSEVAQECPRFRILLVGRSGVGKSSLINSVFKVSSATVEDHRAGIASIEREIMSPYNDYFVAHDSEGYEPGDAQKFNALKNFITEKSNKPNFADRLHAIWLCITAPYGNGRIFETGDEEICNFKQLGVPVIIVFTKYDLLLTAARRELLRSGSVGNGDVLIRKTYDLARRNFDAICTPSLKQLAKSVPGKLPFVCVSAKYSENLEKLVKITLKNIGIPKQPQKPRTFIRRLSDGLSRGDTSNSWGILDEDWTMPPTQDYSDSRMVTLATAQRVDIESKIAASISIGKRRYWKGLVSSLYFYNRTIQRCLEVLHTDIVRVWNIRGLLQYFLSDQFRARMTTIVEDLSDHERGPRRDSSASTSLGNLLSHAAGTALASGPAAVVIAPIAAAVAMAAWAYGAYREAPHTIRCLMAYIVDLTIIMQTIFKISIQDDHGNVGMDHVEEVIEGYAISQTKEAIHAEIRAFVRDISPFGRDSIIHKIESLIYLNSDISI